MLAMLLAFWVGLCPCKVLSTRTARVTAGAMVIDVVVRRGGIKERTKATAAEEPGEHQERWEKVIDSPRSCGTQKPLTFYVQ